MTTAELAEPRTAPPRQGRDRAAGKRVRAPAVPGLAPMAEGETVRPRGPAAIRAEKRWRQAKVAGSAGETADPSMHARRSALTVTVDRSGPGGVRTEPREAGPCTGRGGKAM